MGRHAATTSVMSVVMLVIGIVLIVRTLAQGGGASATGVILGILFMVAGAGRLYIRWTKR